MRALCSRSYATLIRKLCVSETVSIIRDIYIEHLSGVRQLNCCSASVSENPAVLHQGRLRRTDSA
ncbi:Retrovirus-related Pol polyprotein from type-2 retrotransposable element R2DM [Aphis craccivora]|uniref:Retrovirus-related Pol polyprotein from type-2 retrotransposable element R2DM n=1 Tax=Aphis craccivora TaxID=307492 RepID=A0A6G0WRR0_APHCR|nr:Retrovirus-related Pol polyprotein from type-2 retrotransposable element R2DM [Aphis craccivora]